MINKKCSQGVKIKSFSGSNVTISETLIGRGSVLFGGTGAVVVYICQHCVIDSNNFQNSFVYFSEVWQMTPGMMTNGPNRTPQANCPYQGQSKIHKLWEIIY